MDCATNDQVESTIQSHRYHILALYKFVDPKFTHEQLKPLQTELESRCRKAQARGCILIAPEGINGTITYPATQDILPFFQSKFDGLRYRLSYEDRPVFPRLKVKIKPEIVTLSGDVDPTETVGTYVPPGPEWHKLLLDPDCWVIDTRNDYEVRLGTFRNALNPHTRNFREFPDWLCQNRQEASEPKKIAMFCTGGIRCEKATSLVLASNMFPNTPIYHLEGGILAYLDQVTPDESLFDGECYVFDQRVAVTHGLRPSTTYTSCHGCRNPLSPLDRERDDYVDGVSCRYCIVTLSDRQRQRFQERQKQIELASKDGKQHIHDPKEIPNARH